MRIPKAPCAKPDGYLLDVDQAIPATATEVKLTLGIVDQPPHWSSPLWVTMTDNGGKIFRWCFNRRGWGTCDIIEEVAARAWMPRTFAVSEFTRKHGSRPTQLTLSVFADGTMATTLIKDFMFLPSATTEAPLTTEVPTITTTTEVPTTTTTTEAPTSTEAPTTTESPTTTTTTEATSGAWTQGATFGTCAGSSFDPAWHGNEGGLTIDPPGGMRIHKAPCAKAYGFLL